MKIRHCAQFGATNNATFQNGAHARYRGQTKGAKLLAAADLIIPTWFNGQKKIDRAIRMAVQSVSFL